MTESVTDAQRAQCMLDIWAERGWWDGKTSRIGDPGAQGYSTRPLCAGECYEESSARLGLGDSATNPFYNKFLQKATELFPIPPTAPASYQFGHWPSMPSFNDSHTKEDVLLVTKHMLAEGNAESSP